ncbi:MAG: hypothetical protein CM15mV50_450 [uncultured marine virus]|nr:MAG: hypothetical protein CM15mV50_450 [uncultured marine virus]
MPENRLIDLERPSNLRYTAESQKFIDSSDTSLNRVQQLQDKQIAWGQKQDVQSGSGSLHDDPYDYVVKKIMKKLPNWEIEFDTVVKKKSVHPFEWGKWDCVHLTNTFIKAMTGESLLPSNWKWQTKEQAMQSIFKYGKGKGFGSSIDNAIELKVV